MINRVASWLVLGALFIALPSFTYSMARSGEQPAPQALTYIESSQGLTPPELEGGHTEMEMGDVDGDGNLDLVSIGDHGSPLYDYHGVMVWLGDGAGNWSFHQAGDFGYGGVALGDVNNDGLMDVGYGMHHNYSGTDFGDQLLEVALGDGSGQNWTPWDDGLAENGEYWGMFGTDFADVDNDGDLDIGSISFGCCAGVHVYLNQGDGSWVQSFGFLGGNSDMQFDFGDVNGDGNADLVVSHQYGTTYLGDGTGAFDLGDGNLPSSLVSVALGDVNHDGRDDLALCNDLGGVEVWTWLGPNTWQDISGSLPGSGPYEAVQLFDMDMDGQMDVAAFGNGQVRIWAGDGAGDWEEIAHFTTPTPGYMQAFRVGGDADHNGFPDIVLVSSEGSWPNDQNHLHFYKEASTPTVLEIKPVFPMGGETFRAGRTIFVDWDSAVPGGEAGTISLELSVHGTSGPWEPIATSLPDSGRYQWRIPPTTPSTDDAYIRYTLTISPEMAVTLTPAAFNISGSFEEPIEGLMAVNDSPTILGQSTLLTATVITGTNVLYEWDLGDGAFDTGAVVSHIYPQLGLYTAVVTASNAVSWEAVTTTVEVFETPIASLAAFNDSPTTWGQSTILTATVISGTNVLYEWDLGDESFKTGAVVSHTYPQLGLYTAVVTASNAVSWEAVTTTVEVVEAPITGLAAFNDSPTTWGQSTILTATVISGTNVVYAWGLGDGTVMTGAIVSHVYPQTGLYTAVLTASNSVSSETVTTTVEVVEIPISGLSATNDSPTTFGQPTLLTATVVSGMNIIYQWDLGDGSMETGAVVSHVYPQTGFYTAIVTASNAVSSETVTTTVAVVETPISGLSAVNDSPTPFGEPTILTATVVSGMTVVYEWDLGDGMVVTGAVVSHIYPHTGTYTATVTASNAVSWEVTTTTVLVEEFTPQWRIYLPLVWRRGDVIAATPVFDPCSNNLNCQLRPY